MELLSGGEMIMRALKEEGVKMIFGYPGGAVLHIYDALYQQDAVEHILVRHEQAAVHAADGFARSTGEVGVALVTSGPGATNAITGIATAYMDSIPLVVISGNVPSHLIGSDAYPISTRGSPLGVRRTAGGCDAGAVGGVASGETRAR